MKTLFWANLCVCLNLTGLQAQCPEHYTTADYSLTVNGDFSQGNSKFSTDYIYSSNLYPEGYFVVGKNPNAYHEGFAYIGDHTDGTGNMLIVNGAPVEGQIVWQQSMGVEPLRVYVFSAYGAGLNEGNPALLQFYIDGKPIGEPFQLPVRAGEWKQFFSVWSSGQNAKKATISIVNRNVIRAGNDFALDDILFVPCLPIFAALPGDDALWVSCGKPQRVLLD